MRKIVIVLLSSIVLAFSPLVVSEVFADQSQPGPSGEPGGDVTPVGGGSPIAGGFIILATLGTAYGVKRIYEFRNGEPAE